MELRAGKICSSAEFKYSRATRDNLDELAVLVNTFKSEWDGLLFAEEDLLGCAQSAGNPLNQLKSALLCNDSCLLLAKDEGQLVGYLKFDRGVTSKSRHRGSFTMVIKKSHWGLGIGTDLLRKLEVWATSESIIRLELCVLDTNFRAIKLYEKEGYEFEGHKKYAARVDGHYVGGHWMSKILIDPPSRTKES